MGLVQHNAVIATTWSPKNFKAVLKWIDAKVEPEWRHLFQSTHGIINCFQTIILCPDGSNGAGPGGGQAEERADEHRHDIRAMTHVYLRPNGAGKESLWQSRH